MKRSDDPFAAAGDQMQDDFGVGGRLEDRAAFLQDRAQRQRVGEVAVVGDGNAAAGKFGEEAAARCAGPSPPVVE